MKNKIIAPRKLRTSSCSTHAQNTDATSPTGFPSHFSEMERVIFPFVYIFENFRRQNCLDVQGKSKGLKLSDEGFYGMRNTCKEV